jgi:hypothetical protein
MTHPVRVRPSSLALVIACNASLQLQESVPPLQPTKEKREGTAAHWVARRYLAGFAHELPVGTKFPSEGETWEVDDDMHAGAMMYMRAMNAPDPEMHIEEWLPITRVHQSECAGTPDGWRFYQDARQAYQTCPAGLPEGKFNAGRIKLLRVGDYKYGHRFVEVFENPQLSAYAAGVMELLGLLDIDDDLYIELVLVQPRSYTREGQVRYWRTKAIGLRNVLIEANDAADRALMPLGESFAPIAEPGKHCLDCEARHVCTALQNAGMRWIEYAGTAERTELSPLAAGIELVVIHEAMKQLEARKTGLEAQAEALLRAGQPVPYWHMEAGQSKLTYFDNVNADELVGLGDLIGVNVRKTLQRKDLVVTPTQAIQLGIDPEVMKAYAHRPPGALKLARDNSTTARKVFSK